MCAAHNVLLLTADRVGAAMAGPAIRTVEFARVLAGDGHRVTIASPHVDPTAGSLGLEAQGVSVVDRWGDDLRAVACGADIVVGMTGVLHQLGWPRDLGVRPDGTPGVRVVADAYDPVLFEVLAGSAHTPEPRRSAVAAGASAAMCAPLAYADFVLCATESQRHLVLGILAGFGRLGPGAYDADETLGASVATVPFGLSATPPDPGTLQPLRGPQGPFHRDDIVVLWGGGLWDWLDPVTLIDAVALTGDERFKVFFMAGSHPTPSVPDMAMVAAARTRAGELGLVGNGDTPPTVVFADGWINYAERAAYLCDADIGATLAPGHIEATFAYRTRVLDYLWASLPVLCTAGDDLARRVADEGLGEVVPPGDADACAAALLRLADSGWYAQVRTRVADVAATMSWPEVTGPLRQYCREPRTTLSQAPPTPMPPAPGAREAVGVAARTVMSGVRRRLAQVVPPGAQGRR